MTGPADSAGPLRVSQRRPLACRECTKRKRKCDKQIPCARCRRLNLECSVETVRLRRNTVQHASEIQFLTSILSELDSASPPKISHLTSRVKERISQLQTGVSSPPPPPESTTTVTAATASSSQGSISGQQQEDVKIFDHVDDRQALHRLADAPAESTDPPILTAIEHLAWGRNSAGCYPHRRCACQYRRDSSETLSTNSGSFQIHGSALEVLFVPMGLDAQKLVKFHIENLTWHHNCFHGGTFLQQCEVFWSSGRCDNPLWIALYLSVLSCTVNSIQNSGRLKSQLGVDLDNFQTAQQLFSTMVRALYDSHFLNNLSICSVQAIAISTEVAHNLGLSQLNATMFNAAVRIAECLGLHKIKDHPSCMTQSQDQWEERVEREVGKRVWCQMIIQDHFAIPFTDTYSISPLQYSTGRPLNADEQTLTELPTNVPTISTYVRVLVELAALMPGLSDGLGPMNKRKSRREQYQHILQVDQKMRAVVKGIPSFLLRPDKAKEAKIPWLSIVRRSLAITAAEKIIMIHRPFLFRSFHDPTYGHTRRTCIAAAMTILREHESIANEEDLSIWTHTAFAITAAVILCFEVNATVDNPSDGKIEMYRDAVLSARERLASRNHDILAQRGVALIDAILIAEEAHFGPKERKRAGHIDFHRIFANFSTLSRANLLPDDDLSFGKLSGNSPDDFRSVDTNEMQFSWNSDEIDFDIWFNGIFNELQQPTLG
ncbi:Fungal Zn(2)-Cys(6) binuclear cluster domain-containing protein [Penicillium ucsense]|uniref:Fungal Zn(2)-Cys(6) binuclear cluster domain-containing protein n=1 Tax=Penicillium ucsense TaxID=2839758 RepID=A0A8J8W820_9EURO|nr:Fungal Zn(2)-Cys(6) binuclear cluster domain-containing protein [Penicillium ucsense]KAF7739134.1 Fungal Zn(2)-Cys(6) binuclear cluster domain-containing protein [Penicillium ucsense]